MESEHEGVVADGCPLVYVTDATKDAEGIMEALFCAGYVVTDVALSLLSAHASVQRPNVVLLDIDAEGALDAVKRLRALPGSGGIDFLYLGSGLGTVRNLEDAFSNDGSAFFVRPVDVVGLVRKIEALTGGPPARPRPRVRARTPSQPSWLVTRTAVSSRRDVLNAPNAPDEQPSSPALPPLGVRNLGPPLPMSTTSLDDMIVAPRSFASFGTMSHELQQLLADAERRAEAIASPESPGARTTPEEEIDAVLPPDVLAALDESIEGGEDDEYVGGAEAPRTGVGAHERDTGAYVRGTTAGGSRQSTTGAYVRTSSLAPSRPPTQGGAESSAPARDDVAVRSELTRAELGKTPGPVLTGDSSAQGQSLRPRASTAPSRIESGVEARRFFAEAVARRASGALCFESQGVVRRVVLREGDLVAAASSGDEETLVHFLAASGELPRDEFQRLAGKVPSYGRHAGAALVAHGWLRQEQLWPILRRHAEWITSAALRIERGSAHLEPELEGRLRGEPSVFGATSGAAVFVELIRRLVTKEEALEGLGGYASRLADGPHYERVAECGLSKQDLEVLGDARGASVGDLLGRAANAEFVCVVHALALLGVFEVLPSPDFASAAVRTNAEAESDLLDEEAIRARVRARIELVDEGDYFAVLGVAHDATGYEIRRSFIELRRGFEPSRLLGPRLFDLTAEVRKIIVVLEEAYEILRDDARRERYRRAIEAHPSD